MIVLTCRDLLGLLREPFLFSLHELCLGYIFSFYLCNEPLASSCFDKKHDLLSSFLASLVMEKLWVDLILRYHTRQFHFAQDGRTTYWRTSDSLSQTNPASTLEPQHHYYQALFLTHHYLLRGLFQCKQNCSRDSQTTHREKISLCRIWLSCWVCTVWHPLYLSTRRVPCLWQHGVLAYKQLWTCSPNT